MFWLNVKIKENINGTNTFAASCQEYFELGNRNNGTFMIRPNPDLHAFSVECGFTENGGVTLLKPKEWTQDGFLFPPNESQRCVDVNCFSHKFEYLASNDQIQAITNLSTICTQSVMHVCTVNALTEIVWFISIRIIAIYI